MSKFLSKTGEHLTAEDFHFVQKPWGWEKWIYNSDDYCGKLLFIEAGKFCSFHYHINKDEVLYLQQGTVTFRWEDGITGDCGSFELQTGEAVHIIPGLIHQMTAITDALFFEVSTHHEDSDSYRIPR